MHPIANYDVYIFDCDGVILDSNKLKIDAMQNALASIINDSEKVNACVNYFRNNFGRSRFHHVDVFVEQFLLLDDTSKNKVKDDILHAYSSQCKSLYLKAKLTPGFIEFISHLNGKKYIASGSEQQELREVFKARNLNNYFDGIYGSPTKKSDLVANILQLTASDNAIMFGDAISDLEAAQANSINFIAYLPYSNVKGSLINLASKIDATTINAWSEL